MQKKIAVLPGDGIGTEVTRGAVEILKAVADRYGHEFQFNYGLIGGTAIDKTGHPLPEETVTLCKDSDAVLLGAVGGPKWDHNPPHLRPEKGLLSIRKHLSLYANLRPISFYASLSEASPLRKEVIQDADFVIVRELTGGLYFGKPSGRRVEDGQETVVDTLVYHRYEIKRIIELAFTLAEKRRGKVTSVDKANVLESSRMWREVAEEVSKDFPAVELEHMLVDNAAMQLIRNPRQFDVVVTENMFGDILSDEASVLTGSLGMLPSASISSEGPNLYEPIHGSAPDIAGQNKANPIAAILSAASMLRNSFSLEEEAKAVEAAVESVLEAGYRTADLAGGRTKSLTTEQMTEEIKISMLGDEAISQIMGAYA
ncbi:3-isopropylmalate dehydrogenase [Peribacillus deserti]|uniref:3-isopropylmalate dehydrogenase n=1 Tax=Peribacillus deserti TaxID=673318 RepID=A0A2N5M779_9BACI|nr:3-isopropylmalate dehydrogenase [Peribacillus deserti]PLT30195.1 3-isopropylmalate dehydrogenase [Peribacillus deserti]